jgi:hypothetical protein
MIGVMHVDYILRTDGCVERIALAGSELKGLNYSYGRGFVQYVGIDGMTWHELLMHHRVDGNMETVTVQRHVGYDRIRFHGEG